MEAAVNDNIPAPINPPRKTAAERQQMHKDTKEAGETSVN